VKLPRIHVDFETKSASDLPSEGHNKYSKHPATGIWCVAHAIDDGPVHLWGQGHPEGEAQISETMDMLDLVDKGATVVAHNAPFEYAICNNVCVPKLGWPVLKAEQLECTMAMAYAMALPPSLEKCAAALGLEVRKDMSGNRVMKQIAQPREILADGTIVWWEDPTKIKQVFDYCRQDVAVEREVDKRVMKLSPKERAIWQLDLKINTRGMLVDLPAVHVAMEMADIELEKLSQAMRDVTHGQVAGINATAQLARWISLRGIECDSVAKDAVLGLLGRVDLPRDVEQALTLRQEGAKSSTKKLEAFVSGACPDGRMRGLFQYHGANTGRWAGRRAQLHNMPRPKLSHENIDAVFELLNGAV
jgi:DNA polymerase